MKVAVFRLGADCITFFRFPDVHPGRRAGALARTTQCSENRETAAAGPARELQAGAARPTEDQQEGDLAA